MLAGMDRTEANTGTRAVSDRLKFDEAGLARWMEQHVEGFQRPIQVTQFKGGQSNPTYRIDTPGRRYVLRRKPPGKLFPGAHAIDREARLMTALSPTGFPVPRVFGLCEDESVIGTPFFVMEMVEGRIVWEATFPGLSRQERSAHFDAMNATIARLHGVEPDAVGLGDYGKSGGFVERQVGRWGAQYEKDADGGRVEAMDRVLAWLRANMPTDRGENRIVHGDFRCDNMIFDASGPRVAAVLDWELSTLGDPVADFVYHLMMYRMPAGMFTGLKGLDLADLGIPTEEDYVAAYCARTGRDRLPDADYLAVFVLFRLAAITHGIRGRLARGTASSTHAEATAKLTEPLAELAWAQVAPAHR